MNSNFSKNRKSFMQKLNKGNKFIGIGVYDGLTAKIAKQMGSELLMASGGAIARSMGVPDIGLLSMTEVLSRVKNIVEATDLPVIADIDTGYGGVRNVFRTVIEFEKIGVTAIQLEDQIFPKKCGHLEGRKLISKKEMVEKIRAVVKARKNNLLLVTRTDGIGAENFEEAIERAKLYSKVGTDIIFVESPETMDQIIKIPQILKSFNLPIYFNRGAKDAKTPPISAQELFKLGYSIVIFPTDLQLAAIHGMRCVTKEIINSGSSGKYKDMATFKERETIVELNKYMELEESISNEVQDILGENI